MTQVYEPMSTSNIMMLNRCLNEIVRDLQNAGEQDESIVNAIFMMGGVYLKAAGLTLDGEERSIMSRIRNGYHFDRAPQTNLS